jgi:hypothetical protein
MNPIITLPHLCSSLDTSYYLPSMVLRKLSESKERVLLRRTRFVELNAEDRSQRDIVDELKVAPSTVNSDLQVLRRLAKIIISGLMLNSSYH